MEANKKAAPIAWLLKEAGGSFIAFTHTGIEEDKEFMLSSFEKYVPEHGPYRMIPVCDSAASSELVVALEACGNAFQRIGLDHGVRVADELEMIRAALAKAGAA